MKRQAYTALFIFVTIAILTTLQSCHDEEESPKELLVISTINTFSNKQDFYFTLDNGKTMFPSDKQEAGSKRYADGQRAFVIFNKVDEPIVGYDYNIHVKRIQEILTKEIITLEGDNTEEIIGNDPINVTYMWITQDNKYLTVEYQYYGTHDEHKKHSLNLIIHPAETAQGGNDETDGFINLEFRHNAERDLPNRLEEGYVSFKLNKIKEQMKGKKGLRIRVESLYDDIKSYEIPFPSSK